MSCDGCSDDSSQCWSRSRTTNGDTDSDPTYNNGNSNGNLNGSQGDTFNFYNRNSWQRMPLLCVVCLLPWRCYFALHISTYQCITISISENKSGKTCLCSNDVTELTNKRRSAIFKGRTVRRGSVLCNQFHATKMKRKGSNSKVYKAFS